MKFFLGKTRNPTENFLGNFFCHLTEKKLEFFRRLTGVFFSAAAEKFLGGHFSMFDKKNLEFFPSHFFQLFSSV